MFKKVCSLLILERNVKHKITIETSNWEYEFLLCIYRELLIKRNILKFILKMQTSFQILSNTKKKKTNFVTSEFFVWSTSLFIIIVILFENFLKSA